MSKRTQGHVVTVAVQFEVGKTETKKVLGQSLVIIKEKSTAEEANSGTVLTVVDFEIDNIITKKQDNGLTMVQIMDNSMAIAVAEIGKKVVGILKERPVMETLLDAITVGWRSSSGDVLVLPDIDGAGEDYKRVEANKAVCMLRLVSVQINKAMENLFPRYLNLMPKLDRNRYHSPAVRAFYGRVYALDLSYCSHLQDVSWLRGVHTLDLSHCNKVKSVRALGSVNTLILVDCRNVNDVSFLGAVKNLYVQGCSKAKGKAALRAERTLRGLPICD